MPDSHKILIAPSILSADFACLGEQVSAVEAGGADLVHVDVMDGHFVPTITVGPVVVRALRSITSLPLQVHLMVERPEHLIDEFASAGADLITVHVETCPHLHRTLEQISEAGARPAVTLNPATPVAALEEVLDLVDLILVMTVSPGFGGQVLIPSTLPKVRRLRRLFDERGLSARIEVDGGINEETLDTVVEAGADVLVMGSAIYDAPEGPRLAVERYRRLLQKIKPAPR